MHTGALSVDIDASGMFRGVSEGARNCDFPMWQWNKVIFLFLTMLWCFPGLGMADKSCSEHIAGTMGAH